VIFVTQICVYREQGVIALQKIRALNEYQTLKNAGRDTGMAIDLLRPRAPTR
jgi:hypothetical protein